MPRPAKESASFTEAEQAAMKERAKEAKAEARAGKNRAQGEADVRAKIADMPDDERAIAERVHQIVTTHAPDLMPRTWYGMPAYARDGKVVCFFQSAHKFETRYATLGFNDTARLDNGDMWPVTFAIRKITAETEEKIIALVKKAVS